MNTGSLLALTRSVRPFILLLFVIVAADDAFIANAADRASADRPNIVFILADDLSWSDLGCYGNTVHETPHLDRLAAEGVRFTNGYAPAPICSASRAAILTGKTPARLNFEFVTKDKPGRQDFETPLISPPFTMNLPLEEVTIGEMLGDAGYSTAFFGKWHVSQHHNGYLGWSPTHGPKQQGFPTSDGDFGSHPYVYRKNKPLKSQPVPQGQYPNDTLVDRAVEFLHREHDKPFFLYLSQYYVHDPIHTRCEWLKQKYASRLPAEAAPIRASYGAMVETLDHLVGRVLAAIDDAGHADDTLVLFMSDNGGHPNYTANRPHRGSKWNLYEGGIRVPFIVRWPGHVTASSSSDEVVHGCDLWPTFAGVAGGPAPSRQQDGVSIQSVLNGSTDPLARPQPLVWHFPYYHPEKAFAKKRSTIGIDDFETSQTRPHSAIRDGQWKLLHFYESGRNELYDLSEDIGEKRNLAAEEAEITASLSRQLHSYLHSVDARLPSRR